MVYELIISGVSGIGLSTSMILIMVSYKLDDGFHFGLFALQFCIFLVIFCANLMLG